MPIRLRDLPKMSYRLNRLYEKATSKMSPYPQNPPFSVLNLEVTTRCNSRCSFCAHSKIIGGGIRPNKDMSLEMAKRCIDWYAELGTENVLKFIPVGLGETLLYPHLVEILAYAKERYPNVETFANTNCMNLKGDMAEDLIDGHMDTLTLSQCFVDKADYTRELRTDQYDNVMRNIEDFLRLKGDRRPSCKIHVFDRAENKPNLWRWVGHWSPLLNSNDHLSIYEFVDLLSTNERAVDAWPCEEMVEFDSILVDVEGNVFPCCSALWKPNYRDLILANVETDRPEILLQKTKQFRADPPCDPCRHCARLGRAKKNYHVALACPIKEPGAK